MIEGLTGSRTSSGPIEISCGTGCNPFSDCSRTICNGGCCTPASDLEPCSLRTRFCQDRLLSCDFNNVRLAASFLASELPQVLANSDCCDVSRFSNTMWDQQLGTVSFALAAQRKDMVNFTFSFILDNPYLPQEARTVYMSARSRGVQFVSPSLFRNDPDWPPLQVDNARFEVAAAKQSDAYPCSDNTITVRGGGRGGAPGADSSLRSLSP